MIIVTGAAGFIGSCVATFLKRNTNKEIILVDDFSKIEKLGNLSALERCQKVDRRNFLEWQSDKSIECIIHLGARTNTAEFDERVLKELNLDYSKNIWKICSERGILLIYASSAATYGDGSMGYSDDHRLTYRLIPLNPYGISKNEFDKWALQQKSQPPQWYGLKFFNVYGPNEYHKGRMASVIFHAYTQIQKTGSLKLFRSHNPLYIDGGQLRDFVYIKDVVGVIDFLHRSTIKSGIYNLGTGQAQTFNTLASMVFSLLERNSKIEFIDTPIEIRDKYQYYTKADMGKLKDAGYSQQFTSLKSGVADYIKNYLLSENYY